MEAQSLGLEPVVWYWNNSCQSRFFLALEPDPWGACHSGCCHYRDVILVVVIPASELLICAQGLSFPAPGEVSQNPLHIFIAIFLYCNVLQWSLCKSTGIPGSHYIQWISGSPIIPNGHSLSFLYTQPLCQMGNFFWGGVLNQMTPNCNGVECLSFKEIGPQGWISQVPEQAALILLFFQV